MDRKEKKSNVSLYSADFQACKNVTNGSISVSFIFIAQKGL